MKALATAALGLSLCLSASHSAAQCTQEGKFSSADTFDKFGRGVAVGFRFAAVGAPNDSSLSNQEGIVYVYRDSPSGWAFDQTIQPAGLDPLDLFGFDVTAEGTRMAISALYDDDNGTDAGAVYVYRWDSGSWVMEQKIVNPVPGNNLNFGWKVSMTEDVLAVSQWPQVVQVYHRSGTTWSHAATLSPSFQDQRFGSDVAVGGNLVVVGDPEYGVSEGAIEVYRYTAGIGYQSEYVAFGAIASGLGSAVDVHRTRVVAGAWESGTGNAEVHRYDAGTSSWSLEQTLVGNDSLAGDGFGFSVAADNFGVYIGAPGHDSLGDATGAVYVFQLSTGTWTQVNKLTPPDLVDVDNFGTTMAIERNFIAVCNRFQVFNPFQDSRAVYLFSSCP